jgi:hypothetical protein
LKATQHGKFGKGDDGLDNKTVSTKTDPNESDNQANTNIEKLKFEVAQEMGIKPKVKNKKN